MSIDDNNLLLAVVVAIAVAVIADLLVSRFSRRAAGFAAVATVLATLMFATTSWLNEPIGYHATNPRLSRSTDWLGHVAGFGLMIAVPILVGLGVAAILPHARTRRLLRVGVTSGAVLVTIPLAIMLMLTIGVWIYHDGP